MIERTSVEQELHITKATVYKDRIDLYFNAELSFYPWHKDDIEWFRHSVDTLLKHEGIHYRSRKIVSNRYELSELALPELTFDGNPVPYYGSGTDPQMINQDNRFITRNDERRYPGGMDGRVLALWQSHGKYYDEDSGEWIWQRAAVHRTVEDMYTQSYVLPLLMPMLENSGAYIICPRERDIQTSEIICDNDPAFAGIRQDGIRLKGSYEEYGSWEEGGIGFADFKRSYRFSDNPFKAGTSRAVPCSGAKADAYAKWTPDFSERGEYAVYISYTSLENSSSQARYTVHHLGGESHFTVNQKIGGGTWIYLGTFEFDKGEKGYVLLDNRGKGSECVSADAVKFGGGMGKLEREGKLSGVPSYMEGAHYWMQWAGVDSTITRNWSTDYTNDFATRGLWTQMMKDEKGIPVDLSLAFHTDAGTALADSTIGTLSIYTLRADSERKFQDGRDRILSRLLCDYVQTQVVRDIRKNFNPTWNRRGIWDKSYSECRTTGVPAMILELLSHQNFNDMKLGLDPAFRFTVCRSVYKGILKTLSQYYNRPYTVQPLPVHAFSATLSPDGENIILEWKPTEDMDEPTARSIGYIVKTRIDDEGFDNGIETLSERIEIPILKGHVYSFKIEAFNEGGKSFPSEVLSVGLPSETPKGNILIVNNFTKVSAPAWIENDTFSGFNAGYDSGVPYIRDISYIGENYEFQPNAEYIDNDYPGFGATHDDKAGLVVAGNTFDYVSDRARIYLRKGYSIQSASAEAFGEHDYSDISMLELICGKQGGEQYPIFTTQTISKIDALSSTGTNILISGCNIASEAEDKAFCARVLGYRMSSPDASSSDHIGPLKYATELNSQVYSIERPDGLKPSSRRGGIWLRYAGNGLGAAVYSNEGTYKTVSIGIPIETVLSSKDREHLITSVLEYFEGKETSPQLKR
ncbi:MAG TPA: xanthan lyase [Rikenellaceae bacterium]|nr:xanthan lyase [Rikenellaceae bacterium]